jgi:hypothetical protein
MESASIAARLELVRAGFGAWDADENEYRKKQLAEALWWLCDSLDQEIEAGGHIAANYSRGNLAPLTDMAAEMFKTGKRPEGFERVEEFVLKASMHEPEGDNPSPPES